MKVASAGKLILVSCLVTTSLAVAQDEETADFPPIDVDADESDVALFNTQPDASAESRTQLLSQLSDESYLPGLTVISHAAYIQSNAEILDGKSFPQRGFLDLQAFQIDLKHSLDRFELSGSFDLLSGDLTTTFWQFPLFAASYLRGGLAPTCEGGIESRSRKETRIGTAAYLPDISPFGGKAPLIEFGVEDNELGRLRFQAVQDVENANPNVPSYYTLSATQPALTAEWSGNFGGFRPLIQFGTYDENHSNFKSFGVSWQIRRLTLTYDYVMDSRFLYDHSNRKDTVDRISRLMVDLGYAVTDRWAIAASFIDFGVVQGQSDVFGNPPLSAAAPNYSDNRRSTEATLTYRFNEPSEFYAHYSRTRAQFLNAATEELNDTLTQIDTAIKVGWIARFY